MPNINDVNENLNDLAFRNLGFGGVGSATYAVLHGLNAVGGIPALPPNSDNQGYTFFTKPCLNLSYNNVIGIRKMTFLTDPNKDSMGMAIKCMLSPPGFDDVGDRNRSNIIDDKCAFMPLSNLLLSLSAPPDYVADVYTSSEGYNKEQVSWIDSKPNLYGAYDLTATFANMEGDPITTIFSTWIEYATRVLEGSMMPFPINLVENRIDYQTRIYRLVLDRSKTYVQRIYACGAAYPYTVPVGGIMGYTAGQHLNPEADQIQITFRCLGAMYDDPILITEFNMTVVMWNPDMSDARRPTRMVKVSGSTPTGLHMITMLSNRMYPRIDQSMELEWYATIEDYNRVIDMSNRMAPVTKEDISNSPSGSPGISPWSNTLIKPETK